VASILEMLREVSQLNQDEIDLIMEKISAEMKKLDPEEVPPVVYQALLLTSDHGSVIGRLLASLTTYFNGAKNSEGDLEESEDLIGDTRSSLASMKRSESIVMVHINYRSRIGHPVAKEVVKMLKAGLNVPDLVFNSFNLQLCLSLTSLKQFRGNIVEGLKGVIGKVTIAKLKKAENAWFSEELGDDIPGKDKIQN
jgi:Fanconi anemia group I protein